MNTTPDASHPTTGRRRRRFNKTLAKAVIVLVVGACTAAAGALTGLGAQMAFAPMLTWMLGSAPEKAQATAMRFAAFSAGAATCGILLVYLLHPPVVALSAIPTELTDRQFWPGGWLSGGLVLFLGATIGALLMRSFAPRAEETGKRRLYQTAMGGLALYVVFNARHVSAVTGPHLAVWHTYAILSLFWLCLLGVVVGGMTQAMGLASGALLVPALYFLAGYSARQAISLSLFVVLLASMLPAWSYARRGLVDTTYGGYAVVGGLAGGLIGGSLLYSVPEAFSLTLFALIVMILAGREILRLRADSEHTPPEIKKEPTDGI